MSVVDEIKGFIVAPVQIPLNRYFQKQTKQQQQEDEVIHYMYFKKHQSNNNKELSERSLFLLNPPLDSTLSKIRAFFQSVAPSCIIENFFLNDEGLDYEINLSHLTSDLYSEDNEREGQQATLRLPNSTGLVVFVDKSAANLAFNKLKKYAKVVNGGGKKKEGDDVYRWESNDEGSASVRFLEKYKKDIVSIEEISETIDQALVDFEQREKASIEELKNMKNIVDEDGFTLVVGKNRKTKKGILGKIDNVTKYRTEDTQKKMKRKEKEDFYRFQVREKKKTEMNELLRKFKDDQEKIKVLKEKKRFRPY
jgi:ribosomal RNA-processing protein 7